MVKHTQTIRRKKPTNCLSVSDHFEELVLKGLMKPPAPAIQKCFKKQVTVKINHFSQKCLLWNPLDC